MLVTQIKSAIGAAPSMGALDEIATQVWRIWGGGGFSDAAAEDLSEALQAKRRLFGSGPKSAIAGFHAGRKRSVFPPKRRKQPRQDRTRSITRRRQLAASGVLPPRLAALFTVSELAALRIISDEAHAKKSCRLTIGAIAARAGCSETTARGAMRAASAAGLLLVTERRRSGAPNLPNVVQIVSPEWLIWLGKRTTRAPARRIEHHFETGGCGNPKPTGKEIVPIAESTSRRRKQPNERGDDPTRCHGGLSKKARTMGSSLAARTAATEKTPKNQGSLQRDDFRME